MLRRSLVNLQETDGSIIHVRTCCSINEDGDLALS